MSAKSYRRRFTRFTAPFTVHFIQTSNFKKVFNSKLPHETVHYKNQTLQIKSIPTYRRYSQNQALATTKNPPSLSCVFVLQLFQHLVGLSIRFLAYLGRRLPTGLYTCMTFIAAS